MGYDPSANDIQPTKPTMIVGFSPVYGRRLSDDGLHIVQLSGSE